MGEITDWIASNDFERRIRLLMQGFHVPGISIAIVHNDVIRTYSYGLSALRDCNSDSEGAEEERQCTPTDIFDVASCSKAITALALALLVERHPKLRALGWKTPVVDLLGEDFLMHRAEDTSSIRLEHVLSHTTGFRGHDLSILGISAKTPDTVHDVTRNLRNLPSSARPGETYQYCNIMYAVASHVIETLSGISLSQFLHTNVFEVLGMHSTRLQPSEVYAAKQGHRLATPYFWENGKFHATPHQETPELQGAGSIQSTAQDYLKFIQAMLNHDDLPVTKSIYDDLIKPRVMKNSEHSLCDFGPGSHETAYALGWDVKYRGDELIIAHDGVITGFGSKMFFLPAHSFGAVILGNSNAAFTIGGILQNEIVDKVLGVPEKDRFDISRSRLKRATAQEARKVKNMKRNAERRMQARGTTTISLENYCGVYHNTGYHDITLDLKDDELRIEAPDRTSPISVTLEHLANNRDFRGYVYADDGDGEDIMSVRFELDGNSVTAIGLVWEASLGEDCYIWHHRKSNADGTVAAI